MGYKYPSLRTTAPVAGYYARLDSGAAATDQFTADGSQDGTLTNGATRVDNSGLAYSLTAASLHYISLGSPASLAVGASESCAIAAWINTTQTTIGHVYRRYNGTDKGILSLTASPVTSGRIRATIRDDNTAGLSSTESTSTINTGSWIHVGIQRNKVSGKIEIWVNGVKENEATDSTTAAISTGAAAIGRSGSESSGYFNGLIDDFLFFRGVVLTSTQWGYLASQRGAIYQLLAGSSPINGQSLIRPADSKPYQQLIGV